MLTKSMPERAAELLAAGQRDITSRYNLYKQMADMDYSASGGEE